MRTIFSIQSQSTTSLKLSQFSGKYLYDNVSSRDVLDIKFNAGIVNIKFTFATVELQNNVPVPSDILLIAYLNSSFVGSIKAYGSYSTDSYPEGTLLFSVGQPFNWVRISVPANLQEQLTS